MEARPANEQPKPGIDVFAISKQVEAKKAGGVTFQGFLNDGEVTCHAVDPETGKVSGSMLPLRGEELARSLPEWTYFRTNADRIKSEPALTLRYANGELVYTDKQGKEHRAKSISEMPSDIANILGDIQEKTIPNNAFGEYNRLMSKYLLAEGEQQNRARKK
jgi:hypothetical protein